MLFRSQPFFYSGELDSYLGAPFAQGRAWLVATPASTLTLHLNDHAGSQQLAINVAAGNVQAATLSPDDGSQITAGARLPLAAQFAAGSDGNAATLSATGEIQRAVTGLRHSFHWLSMPASDSASLQWQDAAGSRALSLLSKANAAGAALTLSGAGNNQIFAEGSDLSLSYQVGEVPAWVELQLLTFNGQPLQRLLIAGDKGQFSLRLPQVSVQESFTLRARAYFAGDFHYSEQQLNLRVAPAQQLPQPTLTGLPSVLYAGSQVELRLNGVDAARYRLSLEALNGSDQLLASGSDSVSLRLPDGLKELRVRALINDELGNQQEQRWSAPVVDAWHLQSDAVRVPFDVLLPQVGGQWLARGAELHDASGLRQRLGGDIAAMDYLQHYLLLSVKGFGLTLLDPTDNLQTAGTIAVAAPLQHLAVQGERILAASGRDLYWFDAVGNQLKAASTQTLGAEVRALLADGDGFLALTSGQLLRLSASGQTQASFTGEGLLSVVRAGDYVQVLDNAGRLWRLDASLKGSSTQLGLGAKRLFALPGQVLAVAPQRIQLIDSATQQRVGNWSLVAAAVDAAQWAGGKLWLGGSEGQVLSPVRGSDGYISLYDSRTAVIPTRGSVESLALRDGQLLIAADNFGAQVLRQDGAGTWQSTLYPETAFTKAASKVAAAGNTWFVLQDQQQQVQALNRSTLATRTVFNAIAASDLAVSSDYLIVASGGSLQLAALSNLDSKRSLLITAQENLRQLSARGQQVAVLSESGRVFLVDLRSDAESPSRELSAQLGGEVRQLALNGDYLFYLLGDSAWRYDLRSGQRSQLLTGASISNLYLGGNLLWLEQAQPQGVRLDAVEPATGQVVADSKLLLAQRSTALTVENNRLAVGQGTAGVQLFQLPYGLGAADAAALTPLTGSRLTPAQALPVGLNSDALRGATISINGQPVGNLKQALNQTSLRLPAGLPGGQNFALTLRSEDVYGVVRESVARDLFLMPGDGVANPFTVSLTADEHSWLPLPLTASAQIAGSQQPLAQVEFLLSATSTGPWQRVAVRKAEPFQASLALDTSFTGQYLKARAVDVFGNSAESAAKRFYRHQDTKAPTVSLSYEGAAVFLDSKKAVRGYPFTIKAQMADTDGALDKATLLRNGQVVAVAFGKNLLTYQDAASSLGEQVYNIEVRDQAGNASSAELRVTVIDDAFPEVTNLVLQSEIIERSSFNVQLSAKDDVGLKAVDLVWNGFTDHYDVSGMVINGRTFTVQDKRTERVATTLNAPFKVLLTDSRGQVSESSPQTLRVVRDQAPNAQLLQVTLPARGVYGGLARLSLGNLNAIDDTGGLALRVVQRIGDVRQELFSCLRGANDYFRCANGDYWNGYARDLRMPDTALPNDQFRVQVELTDRMGQQVLSQDYSVALTQSPNLVSFVNLQGSDNPASVSVQGRPLYRVKVQDAAARPVPDQPVQWRLRRLSDGYVETLGTSTSDASGYAGWTLDADRSMGDYQLWADLPQFSQIARAEKNFSVQAGPTRHLLLSYLPPMAAGSNASLSIQAQDLVLNNIGSDQGTVLQLTLPANDFHVAPGSGIQIGSTTANGQTVEQVRVTLKDGRAVLNLQAGQSVGQFSLPVSSSGNSIRYTYNGAGSISNGVSALTLDVLPAAASHLRLLNDQGRVQADGDVLARGVKQDVRLQVMLQDRFGNRISQLDGQPANLSVQARVSGAAAINGQAGSATVELVQGQAWLAISDETFEEVSVSLNGPVAALPQLNLASQFRINFTLQPPEIIRSVIEARDGTTLRAYFDYDEPVRLDSGSAIKLLEGTGVRNGTATLSNDGRTLSFVAQPALQLGRCYSFDTSDSGLRGVARNDEVREQGGELCAPHALFNTVGPVKLLAGQSYQVPMLAADNINWWAASSTRAELGGQSQGFNWYYGPQYTVTVPTFFTQPNNVIADGALLPLTLTGTIAGTPAKALVIGNALSIQVFDPLADFDGDGLLNKLELETIGLDPTLGDTNGNGIADGAEDLDGDGLTNLEEQTAGTKLRVIDTDGDGLSDGAEVRTHHTDPLKADTDGDGLSDGQEVSNIPASSPLKKDTDGDGIPDKLELDMGLNPSDAADGAGDKDNDGLSNAREVQLGTLINNPDSDGDTLKDGVEVDQLHTDPLKADTDGDGLRDDEDSQPLVKDTQAPTVTLVNPAPGKQLIKGLNLVITPSLADNGRVTKVSVRLNGAQIALLTSAPFTYAMALPSDADSLRLELIATDTNNNSGTTGEQTYALVTDPLTTVIGRVLDSGNQPIANAQVETLGITGVTAADGSFVLTGVPVAPGHVQVIANGILGSQGVTATSADVEPVWGGTTDVGTITLVSPKVRVGYFNASTGTGSNSQRQIIERAGYEPVLVTSMADLDMTSIDMLMIDSSRQNYGNTRYSNYRSKVFAFVERGGVLIFNEEYNPSGEMVDVPGQPSAETVWVGGYQNQVPMYRWSELSEGKAGSWWPYRNNNYGGFSYMRQDSLGQNLVPLTYTGTRADKRITAVRYTFGQGQVYFGYQPTQSWRPGETDALFTIQQPNILVLMHELTLKDSDNDGLKDVYEYSNGTSAFVADRDGDGLLDGFEVKYGFNPLVAGEQNLDSDGDGLSNLREQELGTHPLQADSDADGLNDGAEVDQYNSDPLSEDTDLDRVLDNVEVANNANPRKADSDDDGISDYEEINSYGTKANNADTDGDGLSDFIETKGPYEDILDPRNAADANQDYDQDGLTNKQEILDTLTNPKVKDSDNDGLSDGAEVQAGLNPLDADMDKDGLLDGEDAEPQAKDLLPPQVALTAPAAGSSLVHGQQLRLVASATDNGRVTDVTFYVNGAASGSFARGPYEYVIVVPEQGSELTVEVSARDTNGNESRTSVQRFSISADAGTQVTGRVVDGNGTPVAGAKVVLVNEYARGPVQPVSYSLDQTPHSSYADNTGKQLIDDQIGVAGYNVNLGQGTAYEWLGWNTRLVNVDFDFGRTALIDTLKVGATQESSSNVTLPSLEVFQRVGENWVSVGSLLVPPSSANDFPNNSMSAHRWLEIAGLNIQSRYVRVTLKGNGNWIFVDEIDFANGSGSTSTPDNAATTDSQGRYSLNAATTLLDPQVKATALFGQQAVSAISPVFVPVRGGSTSVADLVLSAEGRRAFEPIQGRHLAYDSREQNAYKTLYNQYAWDFYTYYGNVQIGSNYAFSSAQYLLVNENYYTNESPHPFQLRQNGRELTLPAKAMNSLQVSRKLYVPQDQAYARYLDLFENTTNNAITVPVRIYGNFYNDSRRITATSSGDLDVNSLDRYLVSDDATDNGGRPASGVLFGGQAAPVQPTAVSGNANNYSISYVLTVPAHSRKAILHYAVQNNSRAEAKRILEALSAEGYQEPGLTVEEQRDIANWTTLVDTDLDGIADLDEVLLGLDPLKADSDNDGLNDGFEQRYGFDPKANDGQAQVDTDGDGLSNLQEQEAGSNPRVADTDGDGLSDGVEVLTHHTNPLTRDTDLDGLLDADEINRGTNPSLVDSDGDGLSDYAEIYTHGTDPLKVDSDDDGMSDKFEVDNNLLNVSATADTDNDGLNNLGEFLAGTNPRNIDTDGDEMLDGWEVLGTPPSDPLKADGDGGARRDINERFVDGTNPKLASDDRPNINGYRSVNDENNRNWNFYYDGYVNGTTGSAIDGNSAFQLYVDGNRYGYWQNHATSTANGREYHYEARRMNNLVVSRRVLVPSAGGAYVRYLEIIDNPTAQEQVTTVRLQSYYGAANDSQVAVVTSSGDAQLTTADDFLALRDTAAATRPVLLHVLSGNGNRRQSTSYVNQAGRLWQADYQLRIPAGERRVIMHFATLEGSTDAALATAAKLRSLKGLGLDNLDATVAGKVVNFFAFYDRDEDGLSDADEIRLGTDIDNPDSDSDGIPDGQDSEPLVADATAPNVSFEQLPVVRRYAGEPLDVTALVNDNGIVTKVELLQDGELRETRTQGGRQTFTVLLPNTASTLLQVRATDSHNNVRTVDLTVDVNVVPELTFSGQVLNKLGGPVAGATVQVKTQQTTTDANGRYSLVVLSKDTRIGVSASAVFGAQRMIASAQVDIPADSEQVNVPALVLDAEGRRALDMIPDSQLSYEGDVGFYLYLSGNGYQWDIGNNGSISDGTNDAYDGGQNLTVNGQGMPGVGVGKLRLNGREVTLPAQVVNGGLRVSRKIYVPADKNYARFLELIENPTDAVMTVPVSISGNLGSDGGTQIINTSSGDKVFNTDDYYLLSDDGVDNGQDPAMGHLFGDAGSTTKPVSVSLNGDNYAMNYSLTLQPHSRQVLMHYAVQNYSRAETQRILTELSSASFEEVGLTVEEHAQLVNWQSLADSDNDGMPDAEEIPLGLDPNNGDWDNDGIPDGQDDEPKVADVTAPVATFATLNGPFYAGDSLSVSVQVRDNGLVKAVEFWQDGVLLERGSVGGDLSYTIQLPEGVDSTHLEIRATDSAGNRTSNTLDVAIAPRPLSTFTLRAANQLGGPIAGASVELRQDQGEMTISGETDAQGRFTTQAFDPRQTQTWTLHLSKEVLGETVELTQTITSPERGASDLGDLVLVVDESYVLPMGEQGNAISNGNYYDSLPEDFSRPYAQVYASAYDHRVTVGDVEIVPLHGNFSVYDSAHSFYVDKQADRWVISWVGWVPAGIDDWYAAPRIDMQVILHRDGRIEVRYYALSKKAWQGAETRFRFGSNVEGLSVDFTASQNRHVLLGQTLTEWFDGRPDLAGTSITYTPTAFGTYQMQVGRLPGRTDTDGDGLSDVNETLLGTALNNADTDGDQLLDGFEFYSGFDPLVAEDGIAQDDPDGDGLSNLQEQEHGTDPHNSDTDGDGLSDGEEVNEFHTDPTLADTDGDGLSDRAELQSETPSDPLKLDTDGDGLFDADEVNRYYTDPTKADTDDDGMPDKFEIDYSVSDSNGDEDGDGVSNLDEFRAGTHPRQIDSDGDGLPDKFEIDTFGGTAAKTFDSDGSGRGDGDELFVDGTDPLDASDDMQQLPNNYAAYLPTEAGLFVQIDREGRVTFSDPSSGAQIGVQSALVLNGYTFSDTSGEQPTASMARQQQIADNNRGLTQVPGQPIWRTALVALNPGLLVSREYYVPASGRGFVRVLDRFYNVSNAAQSVDPQLESRNTYSSIGYTQATSSGDSNLGSDDTWLRLRKAPYEGEEPTAVSTVNVFADAAGRHTLNADLMTSDAYYQWSVGYHVEVPANEHRVVMNFIAMEDQNSQRPSATNVLQNLGENALYGISNDDRSRILNFSLCADADKDLLCDSAEGLAGTQSNNPDSDGDRFNDELEVRLGSDPTDAQSTPLFDIYTLSDAGDNTALLQQTGYTGSRSELHTFDQHFAALDFDNSAALWLATAGTDNLAFLPFDIASLSLGEGSAYEAPSVALDSTRLWLDPVSLHLFEATLEEGADPVQMLKLQGQNRWGTYTLADVTANLACGSALSEWQGQALLLNGCALSQLDSTRGEWLPLVNLDFAAQFAEQPRVLAMDDMQPINAVLALVEDTLDGSKRRSLGLIDMKTGKVTRLSAMPANAKGLAVKFRDFQNEPKWPFEVPQT